MERRLFKHTHTLHVRNYEIDWQGIVHNGNYLLYCEVGRVEYLRHIGTRVDLSTINGPAKVVLVRNEINYRDSARLNDELRVLTRIASIRNTSFTVEGLIVGPADTILIENVAYHVWLDPETDRPMRVPDDFRARVMAFEGADCLISDSSSS